MNGDYSILSVTQVARERIREFQKLSGRDTAAIRITVNPQAPIERKYELEFVALEAAREEDIRTLCDELVFLLDPRSASLLSGTRIDYKEGMWSSGFLFDNPNRLAMMADPLALRIQRVIEERVIPMVATHGGRVSLVDVRDQQAFIQFGGGCQGCGLAPQTLKQGVVEILRRELPEILDVVDVTDHAAGENPYYR